VTLTIEAAAADDAALIGRANGRYNGAWPACTSCPCVASGASPLNVTRADVVSTVMRQACALNAVGGVSVLTSAVLADVCCANAAALTGTS
jgi:hypothetical protein